MEAILQNIIEVLLIIMMLVVIVNCVLEIINGRKLHKSMLEYYNSQYKYLNCLKEQSETSEDN